MEKEYSEIIVSPQRLSEINPNMIGLFFEDLSNSADGGLYAELVKNRSFGQLMPTFEYTINEEGKRKERLIKVENAPDYGWSVLSGKAEFKIRAPNLREPYGRHRGSRCFQQGLRRNIC